MGGSLRLLAAGITLVVAGCGVAPPIASPAATSSPPTTSPTPRAANATAAPTRPPPSPSSPPSVAPSAAQSAAPSRGPSVVPHDPEKFGFAAKGMTNEVVAFVPVGQLEYAVETMDWDVVSTVAYFSLEATKDGTIADDPAWKWWNSDRMDRLIEAAHANGSKVVMSLERFSWSQGQTAVTRQLLGNEGRRERLAREVAAEVVRRGVDGVNVDFEPIPSGQKDEFTAFVRALRRELDAVAPGLQLTFCVVGYHDSYDVGALTGPGAADAVFLMGYHYAGTWSSRAGSTAPMGGSRYDVIDTVVSLLREIERHELIVGVPYYGHAWPTADDRVRSRTQGGGFDVPYERAVGIAADNESRYDDVEQVTWVPYRARPCDGCTPRWYQLYYDDHRAAGYKWAWIKRNKLLGTGVWTIGYEGGRGRLTETMRSVFLPEPPAG